eukprot:11315603-Alexandrium_andersonii.AAC.1
MESQLQHGRRLNQTNHSDKNFVTFIVAQTLVLFNHVRRIKNSEDRLRQCLKNLNDEDTGTIETMLEVVPAMDDVKFEIKRLLKKSGSITSLDNDGYPK